MIGVKFITLGTLKESYLREAAAEYEKRLGAFCRYAPHPTVFLCFQIENGRVKSLSFIRNIGNNQSI